MKKLQQQPVAITKYPTLASPVMSVEDKAHPDPAGGSLGGGCMFDKLRAERPGTTIFVNDG